MSLNFKGSEFSGSEFSWHPIETHHCLWTLRVETRLKKENFPYQHRKWESRLILRISFDSWECLLILGEQWWRSGENTRLPPMWPVFDSQTRRHMWVEFVDSLQIKCSERFSPGYSGFPLSSKTCIWLNLICINFNLQCPQLVCLNAK